MTPIYSTLSYIAPIYTLSDPIVPISLPTLPLITPIYPPFQQPANILLDENGHVRISDLGLACDYSKKKPHASVLVVNSMSIII